MDSGLFSLPLRTCGLFVCCWLFLVVVLLCCVWFSLLQAFSSGGRRKLTATDFIEMFVGDAVVVVQTNISGHLHHLTFGMSCPGLCPSLIALHRLAGLPQMTLPNWLSTAFNPADGQTGMQAEIESGLFATDDLLARVQADLDAFFWQSHTLSHLTRDNLGKNDCDSEDAGQCHCQSRVKGR